LLAHVISDIGLVRETNEDSYICDPPHLFIVADGMGGHVAGEIASKLAVSTVTGYIQEHVGKDNLEVLLKEAITQANTSIYQMALSKEEFSGMGTTVTASYVDGETIYWGHVGDSRIYLLRNGKLHQITSDHSLVWELVQSGNITKDEAYVHPKRNMLTRAVGTSCLITVDTGLVHWKPGDIVLMCTDGLTNMVSEQEICTLMQRDDCDIISSVKQLVTQAKGAGGFDNITVILFKNEDV
jgi:serine/threonine protein phosphatase PrpC